MVILWLATALGMLAEMGDNPWFQANFTVFVGNRSRNKMQLPWITSEGTSRLQHYLNALVFLVAEDAVAVGGVIELHMVGDDERGFDVAVLDAFEQRAHVSLTMGLARFQGQPLVDDRAHRHRVNEPTVGVYCIRPV